MATKTTGQILATTELFAAQPSTAPTSKPNSIESEKKKRAWLDKWLVLKTDHHPRLRQFEDEAYAICNDYRTNPARGRTVVIWGENGCGKTHVARRICQWANRVRLPLVERATGPSLPVAIRVNWPFIV